MHRFEHANHVILVNFLFQNLPKIFLRAHNLHHIFAFSYDSCCSFVNNFIFFLKKWIIFFTRSLKNSQIFFIQSLPLYTLCLFFMLLNDDIVDIEKLDGNISTYFCCRWIFRIVFTSISLFYYTLKICMNNKWCFIRLLILIKV